MDTLLDALQEGRLIELPHNDKEQALQFLAYILEAIPSVPGGTDIVGRVLERERSASTALGKGWACPHARLSIEEDLICVVGWSPTGIEYDSPDGLPVYIIVMYLVPTNQRNHYLREVSQIAKALIAYPEIDKLHSIKELNDVRNHLLDLITATKETVGPETRARMIQLQTKPGKEDLQAHDLLSRLVIEPLLIVAGPGLKLIALTQNNSLREELEAAHGLIEKIDADGFFQNSEGWRIIKRGLTVYQGGRVVYDCLALRSPVSSTSTK